MAVGQLWVSPPQFVDSSGNPYSGAKLFFYAAGSSTKQNTYTDSTGNTACDNPITLNSSGYPAVSGTVVVPFGTIGQTYKIGLAIPGSSDPPDSFIWSVDNIDVINDTTVTVDQWLASGLTPTYVSATSFTLSGDQTTNFHVGRRLKSTNSGGTIYSTITVASHAAGTSTITVVNDSGTLDAGLSAVSYGVLTETNKSIPPFNEIVALSSVAGTNTITASATRAAAPYTANQTYVFIPAGTNTGATTININSLGAKNVFIGGAACVGGEIRISVPCVIQYDGTQMNLIGPYVGGSIPTGQVKFPASQNASTNANTLDDYEEGDWTPVLTFATAGDVSVTYATQDAYYVKIGQLVMESLAITTSAFTHTTASGNARITGSSFTANSLGVDNVGSLRWGGITKANYTDVNLRFDSGGTFYVLTASGSGQAASTVTTADMPTGGTVALNGTCNYRASA